MRLITKYSDSDLLIGCGIGVFVPLCFAIFNHFAICVKTLFMIIENLTCFSVIKIAIIAGFLFTTCKTSNKQKKQYDNIFHFSIFESKTNE